MHALGRKFLSTRPVADVVLGGDIAVPLVFQRRVLPGLTSRLVVPSVYLIDGPVYMCPYLNLTAVSAAEVRVVVVPRSLRSKLPVPCVRTTELSVARLLQRMPVTVIGMAVWARLDR